MNEKINLGVFEWDGDRVQMEISKTKSEIDQLGAVLSDVKKQSKAYSREIVDLAKAQSKLTAEGKEGTDEFKQNAKTLENLKKKHKEVSSSVVELEKTQKSLKQEYRDGIKILQAHAKAQDINIDNYSTEGKSIRELRRESQALTTLRNEMKTVVGEESEEIKKLNGLIEQNTQAQKDNVNENQKRFYQIGQYQEQLSGSFTEVKNSIDALKNGQFGAFATSVKSGFAGMTSAAKTFFFTLMSNPYTATIAIIGAFATATALVAKEFWNYNESIRESVILTEQITKLQGEAADQARNLAQSYTDTFGGEFKENLQTATELVNDFGISYEEAFAKMQEANIKGANQNNELNDTIREYGGLMAQAGYSAQEFIDIVNSGVDLGIYKDKLPDAIKEAAISLNEQTPATRSALENAFGGAFSDDLLNRINKGTTSIKDGLNEIAQKAEKTNLSQQQLATLTADVFRGAGEDAGGAVKIFEALNYAVEDSNRELTELESSVNEVAEANNELQNAKDKALKSDAILQFQQDFKITWIKIKTWWYELINNIGEGLNKIEEWGAGSGAYLRGVFKSIPETAIKGFSKIKVAFSKLVDNLKSGGAVLDNLLSGDFDAAEKNFNKFKQGFSDFADDLKNIRNEADKDLRSAGNKNRQEVLDKIFARRESAVANAKKESNSNKEEEQNESNSDGVKQAGQKLAQAQKEALNAIKETNTALAEQTEIASRMAQNELTQWIANNASKIEQNKRLNNELINQEYERLNVLLEQQTIAREKERESKEFKIQQEIDALEAKKSLSEAEIIQLQNLNNEKLLINSEYEQKALEQSLAIEDKKRELKKAKELQDKEDEKLRKALEFEEELLRLEEEGATRAEIERERQEENYRLELERLEEQRLNESISYANYLESKKLLAKQNEQTITQIQQTELQTRIANYQNMFGSIASLLGKHTMAGKAAGIAQATINTYQGVTAALATKSVLPSPFDVVAKIANVATVVATGLSAVRKITATKTPKGYATGGIVTDGAPIKRSNGDNVLITAKTGEAILNEEQQRRIGFEKLAMAGVPGFARGGRVPTTNLTTIQNYMTKDFDRVLAENIGKAVKEGASQGTYIGSQQGMVDLSTNQQIAKGANHG